MCAPRAIDDRGERRLRRCVRADRWATRSATDHQMNQGATKSVFQTTIQRTLLRLGLQCRRLVRAPMLTTVHRRRRLEFAHQYSSWTRPLNGDRQLQVHRITMHKNLFIALLINAALVITFKTIVILDELDNSGNRRTILEENWWLVTLTAVPLGLGLNPGEDMGIYKCIVTSRHGGILNSRRAVSPLVRLMEGEERWEALDYPQGVLPQNWGGTELNRSITCMVLKATANDRRHLAL
ncbi:uncharacterized protein TNCV_3281621 [Trichonephila clavipes]|nr:uncharacterized protein TNCV_3281621 [Trichonephila clavipes]